MTEPSKGYHDLRFFEYFGDFGWLLKCRAEMLRDYGLTMAPFTAWLMLIGLETLPVRIWTGTSPTLSVWPSSWRSTRPWSTSITRPALQSLPRPGAQVPAEGRRLHLHLRDPRRPRGWQELIESFELFSHLANVGDAKSLVIHPASTTTSS